MEPTLAKFDIPNGNLAWFYEDISTQRFALIVTDTTQTSTKDETKAFSEENNVWVEKVMHTLIKYYEYDRLGKRSNVILMTPRQ